MDLIDEIKTLSNKISKQINVIKTEEATKTALVMPFISMLGYDIFDPNEVVPEYTADHGTKKGEKVDYAIIKDGKAIILFECKWHGIDLDKEHKSQLYRYFSVTEARFAILTNGIIYRFYSDIDEPNKMDSKPFLELNMLDINETVVEELKKFTRSFFDLDKTITIATELKYTNSIKRILSKQINQPSEEFVKFFASQVYPNKLTKSVKQLFEGLVKKALQQFLNDRINERLKTALAAEQIASNVDSATISQKDDLTKTNSKKSRQDRIETTDDEIKGHKIIMDILKDIVEPKRVVMRDAISYCAILFDNNNRKPICRLHFNNPKRLKLEFFDKKNTNKTKVSINEVNDIYQYADRLKETINYYLKQ